MSGDWIEEPDYVEVSSNDSKRTHRGARKPQTEGCAARKLVDYLLLPLQFDFSLVGLENVLIRFSYREQ